MVTVADLAGCQTAVAALCRCRSMAVVPTAGQTVVALVLADLAGCCLMAVADLDRCVVMAALQDG